MAAIGIAKRIDLIFIDIQLDACARDQRSDEVHVIDILSFSQKGCLGPAVIPIATISIGIDHHEPC